MPWLDKEKGFETIDRLGQSRKPFLFIVSYAQNQILAQPLDDLDDGILYSLDKYSNHTPSTFPPKPLFSKRPIDFLSYRNALNKVLDEIRLGNTYLLNLTFKTPIHTDASLKEIFTMAHARYKLCYKEEFVCFSPECFVEMEDDIIATYPMKGTIDAHSLNAKETILNDPKEMAEHVMIVDLMRNDLGMIGTEVKVEDFRYIEEIKAGDTSLLQVSSKITATLPSDWKDKIGSLLAQLLPAGSITGTPKKSTVEIIERIESEKRGFYTGVFGIFDGKALRSAVMIRFISKEEEKLYYQSGGGITLDSNAKSEYQELRDKVYLPL